MVKWSTLNPLISKRLILYLMFQFFWVLWGLKAQSIYIVNSTDDFGDVDLSDQWCADKNGNCTLRAAIQNANKSRLRDIIVFNLRESEDSKITLNEGLPSIIHPVAIFGLKEIGEVDPNNCIIIDGSRLGSVIADRFDVKNQSGLHLSEKSHGSIISGLAFQDFEWQAIFIDSDENIIQNNLFGTFNDMPNLSNRMGIWVFGNNNLIGGRMEDQKNYFLGNLTGLSISGEKNRVVGNEFGYFSKTNKSVKNITAIQLNDITKENLISDNLISGNTFGLMLKGPGNKVFRNKIGTDDLGIKKVGNQFGIVVAFNSYNTLIGKENSGNLISGNETGIMIDRWVRVSHLEPLSEVKNSYLNVQIKGNKIGTDISGKFALGNQNGIVSRNSGGIIIGGISANERNLISGNKEAAVLLIDSFDNIIMGNRIGTDISGYNAIPNLTGIYLADVQKAGFTENNIIKNNQISGNLDTGIYLGRGVSKTGILSNSIGSKPIFALPLKNQNTGIAIDSSVTEHCIGGESIYDKNIIAFHHHGIITLEDHLQGSNPEKLNLFYDNNSNYHHEISPAVFFKSNPGFIPGFEKLSFQETLKFLIQRNLISEEGILQMRKYIEILPD